MPHSFPPIAKTSRHSCDSFRADEPLTVIGLGSNLLVRDGGVRGTVLLLHAALNELGFDGGLHSRRGGRRESRRFRATPRCTTGLTPNSFPAFPAPSAAHWR